MGQGKTHSKFAMSQVQCILCCSPALEDTSLGRIISSKNSTNHSYREFFLESPSYHVISNYEQSDWFSRFLVMLSQQSQDFRLSVPDPFTSLRRRGLGTRLSADVHILTHDPLPVVQTA